MQFVHNPPRLLALLASPIPHSIVAAVLGKVCVLVIHVDGASLLVVHGMTHALDPHTVASACTPACTMYHYCCNMVGIIPVSALAEQCTSHAQHDADMLACLCRHGIVYCCNCCNGPL